MYQVVVLVISYTMNSTAYTGILKCISIFTSLRTVHRIMPVLHNANEFAEECVGYLS